MNAAVINALNRAGAVFVAGLTNTAAVVLVGALIAVLAARCKGWSAATRCCLWWISLAFVVLMPVISCLPMAVHAHSGAVMADLGSRFHTLPAELPATLSPATPIFPAAARLSGAAIFLLCWCAAATVQGMRVTWSLVCGLRCKRRAGSAATGLEPALRTLCTRMRPRRAAGVSLSTRLSSPAVVGYLHPRIMIPADLFCRLSAEEAEQVLLHELAHVRRYDDISIAVQRLVEAIAVFHPLVRYFGHRLDLDREMACDDCVACLHDTRRYAACLAKVAEIRLTPKARILSVPLLEHESQLLTRVRALLDATRTHGPRISARRVVLASAACVAFGIIGLQAPRLLALPVRATPARGASSSFSQPVAQVPAGKPAITSIRVTTPDGRTSSFGDATEINSAGGGREPGSIIFTSRGSTYVIRDKQVLARALQILQPLQELGRRQRELGEQQAKLGAKQEQYGQSQSDIAAQPLDASSREQLSRELQQLETRLAALNSKLLHGNAQTAGQAQQELGELQTQMTKLQAQMGSVQVRIGKQQVRLGAVQARLGSQQAELGKRQAALGARQAAAAKKMKERLQELIRSAQQRGLAQKLS